MARIKTLTRRQYKENSFIEKLLFIGEKQKATTSTEPLELQTYSEQLGKLFDIAAPDAIQEVN